MALRRTVGKVTVETWYDRKSRNWITRADDGVREVRHPRTFETSEYTGNRVDAEVAHRSWVAAFQAKCYACDAEAVGTRDRRPEGGAVEPACDRHADQAAPAARRKKGGDADHRAAVRRARVARKARAAIAPLPEAEVQLAAKLFTVSNLGQPVPPAPRTVKAIERAYFMCAQAHEAEGLSIQPELKSWLKNFRSRDAYWRAEWNKERATITDIDALSPEAV